jgi:hypothetical protein
MAKIFAADGRPPVAIGHIEYPVADVAKSSTFLRILGIRPIYRDRQFGVMELRGGTHIILTKLKEPIAKKAAAPFDLIVDDVDAFRASCRERGLKPSRMTRGSVHDSFELVDPNGYTFTILSTPVGDRPV